ncbi:helix-turn-helix domain-containing protein [Hamadaea tsunoensis]|uniref:helix-turn-helix domain-containing protein n=1 Tax=Hamadaea tsunoensis TaxID=53368 RepID=UPI0003FE0AF6|nr:XRE family transcriptional regulator [Hamadaea tsunoensis]
MEIVESAPDVLETQLAARLAQLRAEYGWSLDQLARQTGVSRSTLSRLERAEISPTASLLGKLCTAYGRTMSRLLAEVEEAPSPVVRAADQPVWHDEASGFVRRSVSPPHAGLRGEVIEGTLRPGADVPYDAPPVSGLEQHIWVLDGAVEITVNGQVHELAAGDCLRFRLWGGSRFRNLGEQAARYAILVVAP